MWQTISLLLQMYETILLNGVGVKGSDLSNTEKEMGSIKMKLKKNPAHKYFILVNKVISHGATG